MRVLFLLLYYWRFIHFEIEGEKALLSSFQAVQMTRQRSTDCGNAAGILFDSVGDGSQLITITVRPFINSRHLLFNEMHQSTYRPGIRWTDGFTQPRIMGSMQPQLRPLFEDSSYAGILPKTENDIPRNITTALFHFSGMQQTQRTYLATPSYIHPSEYETCLGKESSLSTPPAAITPCLRYDSHFSSRLQPQYSCEEIGCRSSWIKVSNSSRCVLQQC